MHHPHTVVDHAGSVIRVRPPALSVPCTVCEFRSRPVTRAPSLRSVAVLRCAQPSLRSARGFATPTRSAQSLSRLGREPREPVWSRSFLDGTHGRTERRGPMGPRPTHVCLVRETRLLPPKAGRLASRSAKPTLDGSSLIKATKEEEPTMIFL